MNRTTIITDASWCPDTLAGGWASWITINLGEEVVRIKRSGRFKDLAKSAEVAEIWALENGIYLAKDYCDNANLLAQSDCAGALRVLRKKYGRVKFRHVKGHTTKNDARSWVNRWCDKEARKHMLAQRKELQLIANNTP